MPRYALECEWDGSAAHGTAPQNSTDVTTLSSLFATACSAIGEPVATLRCSSRLDAGVSAVALPAHLDLHKKWNPHALARALNVHLPDCLAVRRIADLQAGSDHSDHNYENWDALLVPSTKHYLYTLACQPWRPALNRQQMWVKRLPHSQLFAQMAAALIGEKDLSAFACLRGDESDLKNPMRIYSAAEWTNTNICTSDTQSRTWEFRISGRGFLYKQVRGLVGAMVAVACGSYPMSEFERMLNQGRASSQHSGNIAPAAGLKLLNVDYDQAPPWQNIEWGESQS